MNIKQIRELAQIARENGLSVLEIIESDSHVRLERAANPVAADAEQPAQACAVAPAQAQAPAPQTEGSSVDFNRVREIKSPMVGVFYAAPSPEAEPFVQVGSRVNAGDVVCIIEAMKLMNELTSDVSGEVVDVCVHNGDVVEYGQTLFKLC